MYHENEIVMIILGLGTLIFIFSNHLKFKPLPSSAILLNSFFVLFAGWLFTVLEGFFLNEVLNFLEHLCYAISSILVAIWCWKVFTEKKDAS